MSLSELPRAPGAPLGQRGKEFVNCAGTETAICKRRRANARVLIGGEVAEEQKEEKERKTNIERPTPNIQLRSDRGEIDRRGAKTAQKIHEQKQTGFASIWRTQK